MDKALCYHFNEKGDAGLRLASFSFAFSKGFCEMCRLGIDGVDIINTGGVSPSGCLKRRR